MFSNALTYNAEGGTIYNYAKLLMGQCDRILELAMCASLPPTAAPLLAGCLARPCSASPLFVALGPSNCCPAACLAGRGRPRALLPCLRFV